MKAWKIFVKIIKVLYAFIPIHEGIINKENEKNK